MGVMSDTLKSQHICKSWLKISLFVLKWRKIPLPEGIGTWPQKFLVPWNVTLQNLAKLLFLEMDL